jgi:hypothetical protein
LLPAATGAGDAARIHLLQLIADLHRVCSHPVLAKGVIGAEEQEEEEAGDYEEDRPFVHSNKLGVSQWQGSVSSCL